MPFHEYSYMHSFSSYHWRSIFFTSVILSIESWTYQKQTYEASRSSWKSYNDDSIGTTQRRSFFREILVFPTNPLKRRKDKAHILIWSPPSELSSKYI